MIEQVKRSNLFNKEILKGKRPFIISGPCSAESPEQIMEVAKELAETKMISVLRAGIWKPRTRPNSFNFGPGARLG